MPSPRDLEGPGVNGRVDLDEGCQMVSCFNLGIYLLAGNECCGGRGVTGYAVRTWGWPRAVGGQCRVLRGIICKAPEVFGHVC